ncbi:MAG: hypothetical protein PHS49_02100 [Candidatus Gracilibacteria bacterium]|nr:hypothetical protein [Candidatus Gracilibacteria bacterium]
MKEKELEYYRNIFLANNRYIFISDSKLSNTLYLYSAYVSYIYFEEIKKNNYTEELKEIKSHTIFIYLGSIIEAVIYYYVNNKLLDEKSKRKYLELLEYKKLQKIEETDDLYICKLISKDIKLNDSINFHSLINGLNDKKLIDKKIIKKIDYFRKMRNLIHINAFLVSNEYKLIEEIEKAFIDTKDILDYIEENL